MRRLLRRLLKVDCEFCRRGSHRTCEAVWSVGCMCRIIDNHHGPLF